MMTPMGKIIPIPKHLSISIREHGVVEWICPHGVGHPIGHVNIWQGWMGVHGCEGCCVELEDLGCLNDQPNAENAPSTPLQPDSCDPSKAPTECSCLEKP